MGNMASGNHLPGQLAVTGLIVEKHVRSERFEERRLGQAAEKQRLVQTDVPLAQGTDHPFVSRRRARGDQCGADRAVIVRELTLQ